MATHEPAPDAALRQALEARSFHEGEADRVMREAIDDARAAGLSWAKIGAVLGTTGEAARQRYATPTSA